MVFCSVKNSGARRCAHIRSSPRRADQPVRYSLVYRQRVGSHSPGVDIPSKYILYAIRASDDDLRAKATGTTFEAIKGDDLRSQHFR